MKSELGELRDKLKMFADDRCWGQFHSPKNLACALSVEVAELLEHFQWMAEEQSRNLNSEKRVKVESELADIFSYLLYLSDSLGIDLLEVLTVKSK